MNTLTDEQSRARLVPLSYWVEIAKAANVPMIPCDFSNDFRVGEVMEALNGGDPTQFGDAWEWYEREVKERLIEGEHFSARWDCCSSSDLKYAASQGKEWGGQFYALIPDDPRFFDCHDYQEMTSIILRPWVEALRVEGYPVEFRVYHGPNGYQGISSYYPQRPLPYRVDLPGGTWEKMTEFAYRCERWAHTLTYKMAAEDRKQGFTADFLITPTGKAVFIEGGPPHIANGNISAHPCCFRAGEIDGIALEEVVK
jgi:hypothetical protein